jgi:hypothetical protein
VDELGVTGIKETIRPWSLAGSVTVTVTKSVSVDAVKVCWVEAVWVSVITVVVRLVVNRSDSTLVVYTVGRIVWVEVIVLVLGVIVTAK